MKIRLTAIFFLSLAAVLAASCARQENAEQNLKAISEEARDGAVTASVTVSPGTVELDRHLILTLKVSCPKDFELQLPLLEDRAEGFVVGDAFERSSEDPDGNTIVEKVARLAPQVSDAYRIAPMPIVYYKSSTAGREKHWFPTRPLRLEVNIPKSAAGFEDHIDPVWVRPSAKEVSLLLLAITAVGAALFVVLRLIRKALRYVRLIRMSPRDRALEELRMLLEKDLITRNLVKEFYLELTMIVRLFIERGYGIRAPEQTTEEFLESAGRDERFRPQVLAKLRTFLQSADLVKFAGFQPDSESTDAAIASARDFIRVESSENPETTRKQEVSDA